MGLVGFIHWNEISVVGIADQRSRNGKQLDSSVAEVCRKENQCDYM